MTYEIYGPYSTIADARKTIDILGLEGVKSDHILVFANENIVTQLKDKIDARIENEHTADTPSDDSLFSKLKNFFSDNNANSSKDMREKLVDLGIADRQVESYISAIASGSILVFADNKKRMGNDATESTDALEVPVIDHE